jgi:hypothetical protein
MSHIIFMLQAIIALLQTYPDASPDSLPNQPSHHASAYKTDQQFEKRIAYVNKQNNNLRIENAELRGYLKAFDPHRTY